MTAPVQDAGFLAPIVARLERLEKAVAIVVETAGRLSGDTSQLERDVETIQADLREVRACALGRS